MRKKKKKKKKQAKKSCRVRVERRHFLGATLPVRCVLHVPPAQAGAGSLPASLPALLHYALLPVASGGGYVSWVLAGSNLAAIMHES